MMLLKLCKQMEVVGLLLLLAALFNTAAAAITATGFNVDSFKFQPTFKVPSEYFILKRPANPDREKNTSWLYECQTCRKVLRILSITEVDTGWEMITPLSIPIKYRVASIAVATSYFLF